MCLFHLMSKYIQKKKLWKWKDLNQFLRCLLFMTHYITRIDRFTRSMHKKLEFHNFSHFLYSGAPFLPPQDYATEVKGEGKYQIHKNTSYMYIYNYTVAVENKLRVIQLIILKCRKIILVSYNTQQMKQIKNTGTIP